jgi:predicted ATPase
MNRTLSANLGSVGGLLPFDIRVEACTVLALAQHMLGRPDDALKLSDEAQRLASQLKHPLTLALAFVVDAWLRWLRREPAAVYAPAEALIRLGDEQGFADFIPDGRVFRGWAMAECGELEKGTSELEANSVMATAELQAVRSIMLVQVRLVAGKADQALDFIDDALDRGRRTGLHQYDPELHRLRGETILSSNPAMRSEAEAHFRRAVAIAQTQSAKWWELRASVSLARLLRDTNRRGEARTMLADIYNWFTEGFDTRDLQEAKQLLNELDQES